MDTAPILRSAISDVVFGRLVNAILSGEIAPGEALPSERELAETLQVNRHAVREALKRVQQAGLVRISQGGKTRARDWREHAGLDALSMLARTGTVPTSRVLHDVAVMRRSIAADAAALCARVADKAQVQAVRDAATAYKAEDDLAFWTAVIEGSGNLAYRLGLNTLVAAFEDIGPDHIAALGLADELSDAEGHRALAQAITDRDPERAYQLAHALLSLAVDATAPANTRKTRKDRRT